MSSPERVSASRGSREKAPPLTRKHTVPTICDAVVLSEGESALLHDTIAVSSFNAHSLHLLRSGESDGGEVVAHGWRRRRLSGEELTSGAAGEVPIDRKSVV